ncbi:MAG TPA: hypothetical protein VJ011_13080, partial [Steroidobacteraceae bacterium]|nr:hypothetical protein [Steroidobacteraceae bacterium]
LDLLVQAVAERLARTARRARIRLPAGAGAIRARLFAARAVREERSAEDGSLELIVELSEVELLSLAGEPGVQVLEVPGAPMPCVPSGPYLESAARATADLISLRRS